MQLTGMVLWVICLIGQMIFGTGVFATIIVTLFMIIELVSATAFNAITYKKPLSIEEYKPHLYSTIRLMLKNEN